MTQTNSTYVTYPYSSDTRELNIPFEYLKRSFVHVYLMGGSGVNPKELIANVDFKFTSKSTISLTRAYQPSEGFDKILLKRITDASKRIISFQDGSILNANELNISQVQALHVSEEARDLASYTIAVDKYNNLNANGRRIINVGKAIDIKDALTFESLSEYQGGNLTVNSCLTLEFLRVLEPKVENERVWLVSVDGKASDGCGMFQYDSLDKETSDDGGLVIVTPRGARWKRVLDNDGVVTIQMFSKSKTFQDIVNVCTNKILDLKDSTLSISDYIRLPDNFTLRGQGAHINANNGGLLCGNNNTLCGDVTLTQLGEVSSGYMGILLDPRKLSSDIGLENLTVDGWTVKGFFYNISSRTSENSEVGRLTNKNVTIRNCKLFGPMLGNAGNILLRETDLCTIHDNYVEGGTTSAAIGVSYKASNISIAGNTVKNNIEASIQTEDCNTLIDSRIVIQDNTCDGAIWIDDCSDVVVTNNYADSVIITYYKEHSNNITITNNSYIGLIEAQRYGSAHEGTGSLDNVTITNNYIGGCKGKWDGKPKSKNYGIFLSSGVKTSTLLYNVIKPDTFTKKDIYITLSDHSNISKAIGNSGVITSGVVNGTLTEYDNKKCEVVHLARTSSISTMFQESNAHSQVLFNENIGATKKIANIAGSGSSTLYCRTYELSVGESYRITFRILAKTASNKIGYFERSFLVINDTTPKVTSGSVLNAINTSQVIVSMSLGHAGSNAYVTIKNGSSENISVEVSYSYSKVL